MAFRTKYTHAPMISWSVFFLFNAVFAGLIAFSLPGSAFTSVMGILASLSLLAFFMLLWLERGSRNGDV